MKYLLDTNVVSELKRPRPDEQVVGWMAAMNPADLYLSVVSIGEIAQGIEKLSMTNPGKAQTVESWLATLRSSFADRILIVDAEIADRWGRLNGQALRAGQQPRLSDNLLMATALTLGLVLVTRNVKDFADWPVTLLNPWDSPTPLPR